MRNSMPTMWRALLINIISADGVIPAPSAEFFILMPEKSLAMAGKTCYSGIVRMLVLSEWVAAHSFLRVKSKTDPDRGRFL